jgi:hypothetical protein
MVYTLQSEKPWLIFQRCGNLSRDFLEDNNETRERNGDMTNIQASIFKKKPYQGKGFSSVTFFLFPLKGVYGHENFASFQLK